MRTAAKDVELSPHTVPAGAELLYSLTALHREPGHYPNPLAFDPDQHQTGPSQAAERLAFLPLGAGKPKCIGEQLRT